VDETEPVDTDLPAGVWLDDAVAVLALPLDADAARAEPLLDAARAEPVLEAEAVLAFLTIGFAENDSEAANITANAAAAVA
jgi:hypothetical protein